MHIIHILSILATAKAALIIPHILEARAEEGAKCDSPGDCVYSYITGAAQCPSDFETSSVEVPGQTLGSYCERTCTANERMACMASKCNTYEKECHTYPGGSSCSSAVQWCDGPISMLKKICTSRSIGRKVSYDDDKQLCIPEGKSSDSRQFIPLDLGPGANLNVDIYDPSHKDTYQGLNCFDFAYPDVKFLTDTAEKATEGCTTRSEDDKGNPGYYFLSIQCKSPEDKWDQVKTNLSKACWELKPYNRGGPFFNGIRYNGPLPSP